PRLDRRGTSLCRRRVRLHRRHEADGAAMDAERGSRVAVPSAVRAAQALASLPVHEQLVPARHAARARAASAAACPGIDHMRGAAGHRLGSSLRLAASAALLCGCSPAVQEPRGTVLLEWDQPPARKAAGESAVAGYTIYYWRANEGRIRRIDVPDPR